MKEQTRHLAEIFLILMFKFIWTFFLLFFHSSIIIFYK
jgi:hypothetical protein